MKYEYKWFYTHFIKKYKKRIILLKALPFRCNDLPIIQRGKYKGYIGIDNLVLGILKK